MRADGFLRTRRPRWRKRRRRRRRKRTARRRKAALATMRRRALRIALASFLAFGGGYVLATQWLFPAPKPPQRLLKIPDVQGLPLEEAREKIEGAGLAFSGADSVGHPSIEEGKVLGQTPIPGQLLLPGGAVRVAVSLGPERRAIPDVSLLRGDRARTVLETTGFAVAVDSVENEAPRGTILTMDPAPGTETTLPHEIRLVVSLGPPMIPMPFLVGLGNAQAFERLDSLGLLVEDRGTTLAYRRDLFVIDQDPPPTRLVPRGSTVRLVFGSRGEIRRND